MFVVWGKPNNNPFWIGFRSNHDAATPYMSIMTYDPRYVWYDETVLNLTLLQLPQNEPNRVEGGGVFAMHC